MFRQLVHALCPTIYGHEVVKAGLLLALMGGVRKNAGSANRVPIRWARARVRRSTRKAAGALAGFPCVRIRKNPRSLVWGCMCAALKALSPPHP